MYTLSADMSLKLTKQNIKKFIKHFLREEEKTNHSNKSIDDTKSHLNQTYVFDEQQNKMIICRSKKQLNEAIEKRLSNAINFTKCGKMTYKNTGKSVRQDAAMCICSVIQLDPNFYTENTDNTKAKKANADLMSASIEALREMFGRKNVVAMSLHLDETNPHLHIITTPVTEDQRLSKKDFVDKNTLKKFHKDIRNNMRRRGYDIDLQRKTTRNRLTEQEYKDLKDMVKKELAEEKDMEKQKTLQQPQPAKTVIKTAQKTIIKATDETQENNKANMQTIKKCAEKDVQKKHEIQLQIQTLQDKIEKEKAMVKTLEKVLDDEDETDEEKIMQYEKAYNRVLDNIQSLGAKLILLQKKYNSIGKQEKLNESLLTITKQKQDDYGMSL